MLSILLLLGFPGGSDGKASACNVGDPGSIPGWGRSPGEGNGNPLQYSCSTPPSMENPMDGGAGSAAVHGVTKNQIHWVTSLLLLLGCYSCSMQAFPHDPKRLGCKGTNCELCCGAHPCPPVWCCLQDPWWTWSGCLGSALRTESPPRIHHLWP